MNNLTNRALIVIKHDSQHRGSDKGWCKPLFYMNEEDQIIQSIDQNDYPDGIYISKHYEDIDSVYNNGELFILEKHMSDEERSTELGSPQYFSLGHYASSLRPNILIPIIESHLPNREDGLFPINITPPTKGTFFIKDDNKLYGPLNAVKEESGRYRALPKSTQVLRGLSNDDLAIYDFNILIDFIVTSELNGRDAMFIPSLKSISSLPFEKLDYISNDRLVTYYGSFEIGKNTRILAKREAQKLQDGLKKQRKINLMPSERLSRLESIIDQYLEETDTGTEVVGNFLKSEDGKAFLTQYVDKNKNNLLDEQIEKIKTQTDAKRQELEQALTQLEDNVTKKRAELQSTHEDVKAAKDEANEQFKFIKNQLNKEIELAQTQSEEEKQHILAQQQIHKQEQLDFLNNKIEASNKIIDDKNNELLELEKRISEFAEIGDLQDEKKYLSRDIRVLERAVENHSKTLGDPEKLAESMAQVKLVNDILNGRKLNTQPTILNVPAPDLDVKQPNSAIDLVEHISASLDQDIGKSFTNDELLNILISFTQSFLTILSGPPGIGKTSTVIRLADAMNLGDADGKQNFIYIPVGRGWVSSRDILGFYNSLREAYQPARTGLYEFLKRNEGDGYNKSPRLILLDEANLSSIEHYWSDFIGLCDPEGRNRAIDTGHPNRENGLLTVGDNVRFIATINNDSTTERLSPRLIDRAPVITLDKSSTSSNSMVQLSKLQGALDYNILEHFFMPSEKEISVSDKLILDDVINILQDTDPSQGQPIHISPRKIQAIHNYCSVASPLMEHEEALDFAITQHILPHIEGFGTPFKLRLEKLRDRLGNQFPRSKRILDRIMTSGSDFTNSYSFF